MLYLSLIQSAILLFIANRFVKRSIHPIWSMILCGLGFVVLHILQ